MISAWFLVSGFWFMVVGSWFFVHGFWFWILLSFLALVRR
jgi:hypothetical protein